MFTWDVSVYNNKEDCKDKLYESLLFLMLLSLLSIGFVMQAQWQHIFMNYLCKNHLHDYASIKYFKNVSKRGMHVVQLHHTAAISHLNVCFILFWSRKQEASCLRTLGRISWGTTLMKIHFLKISLSAPQEQTPWFAPRAPVNSC